MDSPASWTRSLCCAVALLASTAACSDHSTTEPSNARDVAAKQGPLSGYVALRLPDDFFPIALNRDQAVVGLVVGGGPGLWTASSGVASLSVPAGWNFVQPTDLNDHGEVAGRAGIGEAFRAVRWDALGVAHALGTMYYIPGSAINKKGQQIWIQVLGPFASPTGFDVRLWDNGSERSLGILPFLPNDPSDAFAPLRFKDDGTVLWGYGRWVLRPRSDWRQYEIPPDVISQASLSDVNRHGEVIGVGFRASLGRQQGYLWDRRLVRSELEPRFLPVLITSQGLIGGHRYPSGGLPYQEPVLRTKDGGFIALPAEAPSGFFLAWGWVFDLTDAGDAVGTLIYQDGVEEPFETVQHNVLWTRRPRAAAPTLAMGRSEARAAKALPKRVLCDMPGVLGSPYCSGQPPSFEPAGLRQ